MPTNTKTKKTVKPKLVRKVKKTTQNKNNDMNESIESQFEKLTSEFVKLNREFSKTQEKLNSIDNKKEEVLNKMRELQKMHKKKFNPNFSCFNEDDFNNKKSVIGKGNTSKSKKQMDNEIKDEFNDDSGSSSSIEDSE